IMQAASIVSPSGVYAGISVSSGDGVTVNAGGSDTVRLIGLTITGLGGLNGVVVLAVGTFIADHLVVTGFDNDGMQISGGGQLWVVRDSRFVANGVAGLDFFSGTVTGALHVEGSSFENNGYGVTFNSTGPTGAIVSSSALRNGAAFVVNSG